MPTGDDRQTMMFSATFPANIQRLASDFMRDYVFLTVGRVGSASKDVTQTVEYVEEQDKMEALMRFLLTIEEGLILIFVETKRSCDYVEDVLCSRDFPACSIHGDKSQREREEALRAFKRGETPVMVATDVASRGLDIPNVTQVVNYDLPTNIDDYVHRVSLVPVSCVYLFFACPLTQSFVCHAILDWSYRSCWKYWFRIGLCQ